MTIGESTSEPARARVAGEAATPRHRSISLVTADDVDLDARWTSSRDREVARAVVVIVHGFAARGDHPDIVAMAGRLLDAGMDVVTYDGRGHGRSGGYCGVGSTEHRDVACVVSHLGRPGVPVVVVGVSMGAVATIAHLARAADDPGGVVGAVVVSCPARWRMRPSLVGLATAALTRTPVGRWVAARWLGVRVSRRWSTGEAPEQAIRRVRVPVAVVHGSHDRLLAPGHAERLQACLPGGAHVHVVADMGHGFDPPGRSATLAAVEWVLAAAISPTTAPTP